MKKILALISAMLILTIMLTGCTSQPGTPAPAATAVPTEKPAEVTTSTISPGSSSFPTGVTWRLFSYTNGKGGMANVIGDQSVTALFRTDGTVTGSSGCNQYTSGYSTTGSSIKITPGNSNQMGCSPEVMDQESLYFSLMANTTTYSVNGDTMLFFDSAGNAILAYKKPLDTPVTLSTQAPVIGSWDLQTYNNGNNAIVPVLSGSNLTAIFTPDGKINGSSGCNDYSGIYSLNGKNLGITQVKSSKISCDPEILKQEIQYQALLQRVSTYEMNGDQMILYTILGEKVLTYKKGLVQAIAITPKSTSQASMRTLTGNWALKSYSDGKGAFIPPMTNAPITAKFLADGTLSGSSGCNQYSTTYSVSGTSVSISQVGTLARACEPTVTEQETSYLALLLRAGKFIISGDSMTLYDSAGNVLLNYNAS